MGLIPKDALGRVLRLPRRLTPARVTVPVLATAAQGMRWIARSGPSSYWLGIHERPKRALFSRLVVPGDVVFDIGANVGSYTLLASALVGSAGRVIAFEPSPVNLGYLRRHVAINGLDNVTVIPAAVADRSGQVRFELHPNQSRGGIDPGGDFVVQAVTIDALVEAGTVPPPSCMKIDVEGGEPAALRGALRTIVRHRPVVFVATHDGDSGQGCRHLLEQQGYRVTHIGMRKHELLALPAREA